MRITIFSTLLLVLGVGLLAVSLAGLFIPLRNPAIYIEKGNVYHNDITLSYKDVLEIVSNRDESDEAFINKVNDAINNGVAHYWDDEGKQKYNLRVPFYENYILYFASFVYPSIYGKYEFNNYSKALERGVGMCSQHAIILAGVLEKNNIATKIIGLSGHIVLSAQVDKANDIWHIFDPDAGVVVNHSIEQIEKNPEMIRSYYTDDFRVDQYRLANKPIYDGVKGYHGRLYFYIEILSYLFIWLLPLIFIFFSFLLKRYGLRKSIDLTVVACVLS